MQDLHQPMLRLEQHDCDSAQLDLAEALDSGLSERQRARLVHHLDQCYECRLTAAEVALAGYQLSDSVPVSMAEVMDLIRHEGTSYERGGMLVQDESVPTYKLFVGAP